MHQPITLNLPHELSEFEWQKVSTVYRSMDGWIDIWHVSSASVPPAPVTTHADNR